MSAIVFEFLFGYDEDVSFEKYAGNLTAYGVERLLSQSTWSRTTELRLAWMEANRMNKPGEESFGKGVFPRGKVAFLGT
jgi:hypothetical protein